MNEAGDSDERRVQRALEGLTRELLRTRAQVVALEALVLTLAEEAGLDPAVCRAALRVGADRAFARQLERIEDIDPGLAGDLDNRPGPPPTSG